MKRLLFLLAVASCGGAAEPAMTPSNQAAPSASGTTMDVGGANGEMDRAEGQLQAAQGDCATACRALASMERAAEHICAVDGGPECSRARRRVEDARARVQTTCGGCNR
jgi:hypothetical protein